MARAGELEQIAPGLCARPGDLDDSTAALASISVRKPTATICLLSALSLHELTDQIPTATDIAVPSGEQQLGTRFAPIRWHSFDLATFDLGRTHHQFSNDGLQIGLYSAEHAILDAFWLRHQIGPDVATEELKRWARVRGNKPVALLELAGLFPKALRSLRLTLQILV